MIPPDLTDVSQESPREALGNVIQAMRWEASVAREVAITGVSVSPTLGALSRHIEAWATRLESAVQKLDAEQRGREATTGSSAHLIRADSEGAVPPAEQDTPQ